jgi:hypothetical protein
MDTMNRMDLKLVTGDYPQWDLVDDGELGLVLLLEMSVGIHTREYWYTGFMFGLTGRSVRVGLLLLVRVVLSLYMHGMGIQTAPDGCQVTHVCRYRRHFKGPLEGINVYKGN